MSTLQDRIKELLAEQWGGKRGGQARLAEAAKTTAAAVSMWVKGDTQEIDGNVAMNIERATGWRAAWLISGDLPKRSDQAAPEPSRQVGAKIRILDAFTIPPLMTWEELMSATTPLPELIRLAAPDDALPDEAPLGTELIMSTTAAARRGDIVLVRDQAGNLYLRLYAEGRAGGWRAVTPRRDDVYLSLDSEADGLTLVAVAEWGRLRRK